MYHFVNALEAKEIQNQYGIKITEAQHNKKKQQTVVTNQYCEITCRYRN